jgi:hypothetical protein
LVEIGMAPARESKEILEKRAEASFRKEERVREGAKAMLEYEAEGRAVLKNTARLRALRLAKEAADKHEAAGTKPATKKKSR